MPILEDGSADTEGPGETDRAGDGAAEGCSEGPEENDGASVGAAEGRSEGSEEADGAFEHVGSSVEGGTSGGFGKCDVSESDLGVFNAGAGRRVGGGIGAGIVTGVGGGILDGAAEGRSDGP